MQPESAYMKKTDSPSSQVSQFESVTSNGRYGNGNEGGITANSLAHEHQYSSGDSTDSTTVDDSSFYKNPPLILNSTNPFLNSYTPENIYQSTQNTSSQSSYSSAHSEGNLFSEGSITPTNCEQSNVELQSPRTEQELNSSSKSSKPPPAPPIRRTSSISNPNAITMGTLKSAGISPNYDEAGKNLSVYDEINVLTKSMNDINYTLKYTDFANAATSSPSTNSPLQALSSESNRYGDDKSEYQSVKHVFENHYISPPLTTRPSLEDESSQLPLPAPPPEAFIDMSTNQEQHHHYNKITNVHRDFLETLNSKLSQSPLSNQSSSRASKRRSSNHSSDDCDSSLSHGTFTYFLHF